LLSKLVSAANGMKLFPDLIIDFSTGSFKMQWLFYIYEKEFDKIEETLYI